MEPVTLAIIGGRDFSNSQLLYYKCTRLRMKLEDRGKEVTLIVSGGAKGADYLAECYAASSMIKMQVFPADWDRYGKSAGFRRNKDIIAAADYVIAFWDGNSKGTHSSIELAKSMGKKCFVIKY